MTLLTFGINHKTAPLALREQLAFNEENTAEALQELLKKEAVNEAVLISTCNRTEVYTAIEEPKALFDWFDSQHGVKNKAFHQHCYAHQGVDAIKHLIRVTSGLDSMVLGESQIFSQVKKAYQLACELDTVGDHLKPLFPAAFAASKLIRNQTAIGQHPVSLAYATVQLAKKVFSDITKCRVMLVGNGETIELLATHLKSQGITQFTVASRSLERGKALTQSLNANAIRISEIPQHLEAIDILVSATASQLPIIGKGLIEKVAQQKSKPLFIADLAVPRDIEAEAANVDNVHLVNIDSLDDVIQQNLSHRQEAASQAEALVELQAQHYMQELRVNDVGDIIRGCRERVMEVRDEELMKAIQKLNNGHNPYEVLTTMANNLTNKMLHKPTTQIRKAASQQRTDLILLSKYLFDL
ncbi:MAG: glutamyl-tRNA reductase [Gammaproteobacteria bacterium]|nr:glutamyl-tRNA reductase [Gammaproteobacteria bacterium]MCH9743761.1 glutamyl-tRNA reductase [Gammaproteobacteria bacterium]